MACGLSLIFFVSGCQTFEGFPSTSMPVTPAGSETSSTVEPASSEPVEGSATVAKSAIAVDPGMVENFSRWLDQNAWQVDVQWKVLTTTTDCPTRTWRWRFFPADAPHSTPNPSKVTSAQSQEGSPEFQRWSWVWAGEATDAVTEEDQLAAFAVLEHLAERGGRVGGTAALLQARLRTTCNTNTIDAGATPGVNSLAQFAEVGSWHVAQPTTETAGDQAATSDVPPKTATAMPLSTRCAAAEAWCRLLIASDDLHEVALAPAGKLLTVPGLPDEMKTTLWLSLSAHIPPDHLPGLSESLKRSEHPTERSRRLRRTAVEACVLAAAKRWETSRPARPVYHPDFWPPTLDDIRLDADAGLRPLFGRWAVFSGHPEAFAIVSGQVRDTETTTREAAIISLGFLQTPAARDALSRMTRQESERYRALAVQGLARWGPGEIEPFVTSKDVGVRIAVARGLEQNTDARAVRMVRQLLHDPHPEVQSAAVQTIDSWPLDVAGPRLLEAMLSEQFATRQAARDALRQRLDDAPDVSLDATSTQRHDAIREFAAARGWSFETWLTAKTSPDTPVTTSSAATVETLELLRNYLAAAPGSPFQTELGERLRREVRPELLPFFEQELLSRSEPTARTVCKELLPLMSPVYANLAGLSSPEVETRRAAARTLAQEAAARPLSRLLVRELRQTLSTEQDQLVWMSCMSAIADDAGNDAAQVALVAMNHAWPDIRRLGVEYVLRHPSPEAAVWLLPRLTDPQRAVQSGAIRAAAACGHPVCLDGLPATDSTAAVPGLRALINHPDAELRFQVVIAMATLRDDQAAAELIRLSHETHPRTREQVARAMGATGQTRFVEPLIQLSWTETADPVKQAVLSSLEQLVAPDERPITSGGLAAMPSIDDKIKAWASWGEARRRATPNRVGQQGATEGRLGT